MIDRISSILYDEDVGLMIHIRDGEEITQSDKEQLVDFSKWVNAHLREQTAGPREIAMCVDAIYTFMLYPDYHELGTIMYQNFVEGIDF